MQLYYIRHGQSVNNANWTTDGFVESSDAPLTEIGAQQAQLTAEYLEKNQPVIEHKGWNSDNRNGFGLTHLYTSLMERAVAYVRTYRTQTFGHPFPRMDRHPRNRRHLWARRRPQRQGTAR